jgi:2-hydroxychromene-2-carboxylate isomerase
MAKQVEFFFDYGSPFSYLADTQLPNLIKKTGAKIIYQPILLGGIFKATGNSSPITIPAKGKYMGGDLARWAKHYGVVLEMNPFFPINTIRVMRGAIAAQNAGCFPAYHSTMFRAMWAERVNLGAPEIVKPIFERLGMDPDSVERDDIKEKLKANTDDAVSRGAFGAPTFFVGDAMFWGNDRMDFVEQALK